MEQYHPSESPIGTTVDLNEPSTRLHDSPRSNQTAASRYFTLGSYELSAVNDVLSSLTTDVQDVGITVPTSALIGAVPAATALTEKSLPPNGRGRITVTSASPIQPSSELPLMGTSHSDIESSNRAPDLEMGQGYFVLAALDITTPVVKSVDAGGGSGAPCGASDPSSAASRTMPIQASSKALEASIPGSCSGPSAPKTPPLYTFPDLRLPAAPP